MINESTPARSDTSGARPPDTETRRQDSRAAYAPPRLERLGAWRALTLQQSVPIGPGA